MSTLTQKIGISVMVALVFMFINLPSTYKFTNNLLTKGTNTIFDTATECPTLYGHLIHTAIFALITFLQMFLSKGGGEDKKLSLGIKLKHTFYGSLIFFILSSPAVYKLMGEFISNKIADSNGCPTLIGVIVHSIVYALVLTLVMYFPKQ